MQAPVLIIFPFTDTMPEKTVSNARNCCIFIIT
jgi:hypothetical protein